MIGEIPCFWTRNAFAVPHSWPTCISLQSYVLLPVNTYLILRAHCSISNLKSFVTREKLLLVRKIKMCTNHDDFEAMLSRQKRGRGVMEGKMRGVATRGSLRLLFEFNGVCRLEHSERSLSFTLLR